MHANQVQNPPLQYEPNIDKIFQKLRAKISEDREKVMVANQSHTLMDYLASTFGEANTIHLLDLPEGVTFDIKQGFLKMLENNPFDGVSHEDLMQHLRKFIKFTNMVRHICVQVEYIRLYAFLFSLYGKAWDWLCSLPENNITTWN